MTEPTLSAGMPAPFATVLLMGADSLALEALRAGAIEPADMAVLWSVGQFLCWRSGRCKASTAELALAMGSTRKQAEQGLARLAAANLLIEGTDRRRGYQYLALHPLLCTTGGPHRRRRQWLAFHGHAVDPDAVAAQAVAAGAAASVLAA
jgi:hypothetical protein